MRNIRFRGLPTESIAWPSPPRQRRLHPICQRLHAMLGYTDVIAPQPEVREFSEDGVVHSVLTGDYPVAGNGGTAKARVSRRQSLRAHRWRAAEYLQPGRPSARSSVSGNRRDRPIGPSIRPLRPVLSLTPCNRPSLSPRAQSRRYVRQLVHGRAACGPRRADRSGRARGRLRTPAHTGWRVLRTACLRDDRHGHSESRAGCGLVVRSRQQGHHVPRRAGGLGW